MNHKISPLLLLQEQQLFMMKPPHKNFKIFGLLLEDKKNVFFCFHFSYVIYYSNQEKWLQLLFYKIRKSENNISTGYFAASQYL